MTLGDTCIGRQDRLHLREGSALWCEVADQLVVLVLADGAYLSLNRSAVPLWERVSAGTTTAELAAQLVERYDLSSARADEDAARFVALLAARGLVEVSEIGVSEIDHTPPQEPNIRR